MAPPAGSPAPLPVAWHPIALNGAIGACSDCHGEGSGQDRHPAGSPHGWLPRQVPGCPWAPSRPLVLGQGTGRAEEAGAAGHGPGLAGSSRGSAGRADGGGQGWDAQGAMGRGVVVLRAAAGRCSLGQVHAGNCRQVHAGRGSLWPGACWER
ncbi:unnamed protein product [Eretmochelys imbricata]